VVSESKKKRKAGPKFLKPNSANPHF